MHEYQHRQRASLILWILALVGLVFVGIFSFVADSEPDFPSSIPLVTIVVLALLAWQFGSLTVRVSSDRIRLWFGPGLIRKTFQVCEISDVRIVRNRWYYGWGIRLTPHGWLFNVSGFDAVELEMTGGRKYRIGTDEPIELEAAIRLSLSSGCGDEYAETGEGA